MTLKITKANYLQLNSKVYSDTLQNQVDKTNWLGSSKNCKGKKSHAEQTMTVLLSMYVNVSTGKLSIYISVPLLRDYYTVFTIVILFLKRSMERPLFLAGLYGRPGFNNGCLSCLFHCVRMPV